MNFDPCNRPPKIREPIGTLTHKVGAHLGVWRFIPSHSLALQRVIMVTSFATKHLCIKCFLIAFVDCNLFLIINYNNNLKFFF